MGERLLERDVEAAGGDVEQRRPGLHFQPRRGAGVERSPRWRCRAERLATALAIGLAAQLAELVELRHLDAEQAQPRHRVGLARREPVAARARPALQRAQLQRRLPGDGDVPDRAAVAVDHRGRVLARRRRGLDHDLALARARRGLAVDELAQLDQVAGARRRASQHARDRDRLRLHPALQVDPAEAAAARLDEQADGVAQARRVAADLRTDAAHRQGPVVRIGGGREVPVAAEAGAAQARDERPAEPFLGRLGDEGRQVGGSRVLQQSVEALHRTELRREHAADRVLVQVEHDQWREPGHELGHGARFGRAQQQVVAVDVAAIGRAARERGGAVGIGAEQQDDVDFVEHAREATVGELLRDDDERFGAGRFVAVLGGDDEHRRPMRRRCRDRCRRGRCGRRRLSERPRERERVDRSSRLRRAQTHDPDLGAALAERAASLQAVEDRVQLVVGGEGQPSGGERGRREIERRLGKARRDRRRYRRGHRHRGGHRRRGSHSGTGRRRRPRREDRHRRRDADRRAHRGRRRHASRQQHDHCDGERTAREHADEPDHEPSSAPRGTGATNIASRPAPHCRRFAP